MNQCVPSWDLDDNPSPHPPRLAARSHSNSNSLAPNVPTLDYEVAELTWENGQLAMHGLGPPRLSYKATAISSPAKYSWDKPPTGGTLESIVNQATTVPQSKAATDGSGRVGDELLTWFEENQRASVPGVTASITMTMDALVPCRNPISTQDRFTQVLDSMPGIGRSTTRVGSCSGPGAGTLENGKDGRLARVPHDWSSKLDQSVTGSATCGLDSRQVTRDTCEREFGTTGFTSTSLGSPENTSSAKECTKTVDDHDSACHSRNQREAEDEVGKKKGSGKLSVSTKRSRAAAIHNQSERKRRDKINQRMKTLQKLVPNSSKTDKASMLDEVIEYLKQLQAQVQMMNRMNMSSMMMPLALQQQLQMSMMAPMGLGVNMGMGLGHVMDMNTMAGRPGIAGMPSVLPPTAFVPAPVTWDGAGDRMAPCTSAMPDPLAAFLACQSQPITMDAYSRMAALYQQFQQTQCPASSKNKAI